MQKLQDKGYKFSLTVSAIGRIIVTHYVITSPDGKMIGRTGAEKDTIAQYLKDYKLAQQDVKQDKPPPSSSFFP